MVNGCKKPANADSVARIDLDFITLSILLTQLTPTIGIIIRAIEPDNTSKSTSEKN